jgi:DNA gyrase subunit A
MPTISQKIIPVDIEDEMKGSYIDYSMSVIVARALPDVRDGLKPVHRRVLFGMNELGLASNRPYKKSARVVGEVLGKYHPHGDTAVYDTMVRMAQDFSLRYLLVDGQGNFGSVDGDSPAAMRYTEVRLSRFAEEMLRDLEKNTVSFVPNFDESLKEPTVLPSLVPNLLVNGTSGIAVGMATNIPPHNLNEVVDGLIALIENPSLSDQNLLKYVKAPDFPTGGIIYGYEGVKEAYKTGRGKIIVRAKATIEKTKGDRENIVITELPYLVNKANLIERIAALVREKKIEDIADIRDESDRSGMRILVELKRDAAPEVILNNLYIHTQMQTTFGVNMLALVDGRPQVLTLKQMMEKFIEHRNEVVVRRSKYELDEAEKRAHILEGYIIALDNIDAVIALIKKSKDVETAKTGLMKKFKLSEIQAKAILDMRLQRLTGLERKKVEDEYKETIKLIEKLKAILKSKKLQLEIIKEELTELKKKYGDERRTEIVRETEEFSVEDMIAEEDVVITISHNGFIKRSPISSYRRQARGGRGVTAAVTREDDFIEHMFVASTHQYMLIFMDNGRCYWLKVHEIPEAARMARGRSIANLIEMKPEEKITAFLPIQEFSERGHVLMVTKSGLVKKTPLSDYSKPRRTGITAIGLKSDDKLIDVKLTDGNQDVIIGTRDGLAIRFHESQVRPMGRTALGVRGIQLNKGDRVIGMAVLRHSGTTILVATEHGYGKRTPLQEYRPTGRAGKGVITVQTTERIGKMVAIKETLETDDIVIVTTKGIVIRQHVKDVNILGRNTQGVRLIRLDEGDTVADLAVVPAEEEEEAETLLQKRQGEKAAPEKFDESEADQGSKKSAKTGQTTSSQETPHKDGQPSQRSKNSEKKSKRK